MRWTQDQLESYLAKVAKPDPSEADEGPESRLQMKCEKWLRDHGYPYHHDRSRGKNKAGWFDLTCILPEGRTVYVELKAKRGRASDEQRMLRAMAGQLGHEVHEIRSFKRFIEVMEGDMSEAPGEYKTIQDCEVASLRAMVEQLRAEADECLRLNRMIDADAREGAQAFDELSQKHNELKAAVETLLRNVDMIHCDIDGDHRYAMTHRAHRAITALRRGSAG